MANEGGGDRPLSNIAFIFSNINFDSNLFKFEWPDAVYFYWKRNRDAARCVGTKWNIRFVEQQFVTIEKKIFNYCTFNLRNLSLRVIVELNQMWNLLNFLMILINFISQITTRLYRNIKVKYNCNISDIKFHLLVVDNF